MSKWYGVLAIWVGWNMSDLSWVVREVERRTARDRQDKLRGGEGPAVFEDEMEQESNGKSWTLGVRGWIE